MRVTRSDEWKLPVAGPYLGTLRCHGCTPRVTVLGTLPNQWRIHDRLAFKTKNNGDGDDDDEEEE